jgi:hypothetical protein
MECLSYHARPQGIGVVADPGTGKRRYGQLLQPGRARAPQRPPPRAVEYLREDDHLSHRRPYTATIDYALTTVVPHVVEMDVNHATQALQAAKLERGSPARPPPAPGSPHSPRPRTPPSIRAAPWRCTCRTIRDRDYRALVVPHESGLWARRGAIGGNPAWCCARRCSPPARRPAGLAAPPARSPPSPPSSPR